MNDLILDVSNFNELVPTNKVLDCYNALLEGVTDYNITKVNNNIAELWRFKAFCEKMADSIKKLTKNFYNNDYFVNNGLPKNISFSKISYIEKFKAPVAIAKKLHEEEGTPYENFCQWLTPKQAAEACGWNMDRLKATFGEEITSTPKEPSITIK